MSVQEYRSELRHRYTDLLARLGGSPAPEWQPLLNDIETVRRLLRRTYHSRVGWHCVRARELCSRIWQVVTLRHIVRSPLKTVACDPLGSTALMLSIAERIRITHATADHIELTSQNISSWLGEDIVHHPDFDAARCFQMLNKCLNKGEFAEVNGRVWFEAEHRGQVMVYVGLRDQDAELPDDCR